MVETMHMVIARVRTLLRRPSDIKLPYRDMQERAHARLRGYLQDQQLNLRPQRTEVTEVTFDADDIDYLLTLPNTPDYEPERLEYGYASGSVIKWFEANVVPLNAWSQHFSRGRVAASFYGSYGLQEGMKVKINLDPTEVAELRWRLSYRLPLLSVVQLGERPPIPTNNLPMLEYDMAIDCFPLVRDESDEFLKFMERTLPIYAARSLQEHERWRDYLASSVQPSVQDLPAFNEFRRGGPRRRRAFLPIA